MHDPAVHSHSSISSFRHRKICFSCADTPKEAEKGACQFGAARGMDQGDGMLLAARWWVVAHHLMLLLLLRWAACVEAAISIRTSRIYLTIPWTTGSFWQPSDSDLSRTGNSCSVPVGRFILFTPPTTQPPLTDTSARYCSVFALFPIVPLASLLASKRGLGPGEIFFGRQNVSATWTRSGLSLIRALKHPHHSESSLFRPPPPARVTEPDHPKKKKKKKKKTTRPDWGADPGHLSAAARQLGWTGLGCPVCAYITIVARSSQNSHLHTHSTTIHHSQPARSPHLILNTAIWFGI